MALSTQKGRSFYAFELQMSIFDLYVAMWLKAISKGREGKRNYEQGKKERERMRKKKIS